MAEETDDPKDPLWWPTVLAKELQHILPKTGLPPPDQATLETISSQEFDERSAAEAALKRLHEIIHSLASDQEKKKKKEKEEAKEEGGSCRLAALCLSGGGIRSASFALGVLQALADSHPNLLGRFHYLSTVSGGGYIGSWLSAWINRDKTGLAGVLAALKPDPTGYEPLPLHRLRASTNYLTPRVGIASADTWAAITLFVRNMALNWLILLPVFFAAVALPALLFSLGGWLVPLCPGAPLVLVAVTLGSALTLSLLNRPSWNRLSFTDAGVAAFILPLYVLGSLALGLRVDALANCHIGWTVGLFAALFAASWVAAWLLRRHIPPYAPTDPPQGPRFRDLVAWTASGALFGLLLHIVASFDPWAVEAGTGARWHFLLAMPAVLFIRSVIEMLFSGLSTLWHKLDDDREWFARLTGWLAALSVAWLVMTGASLFGLDMLCWLKAEMGDWIGTSIAAAGGVSGALTAILSWSAKTGGEIVTSNAKAQKALPYNVILGVAAIIFVAIILLLLGAMVEALLLCPLPPWLCFRTPPPWLSFSPLPQWLTFCPLPSWLSAFPHWIVLPAAFVLAMALAFAASYCININRFSQQGIYRNRLMRGFLGPTRDERNPDLFTGFDEDDNLLMKLLARSKNRYPDEGGHRALFHVVNITLNVTATTNNAWQERKAESFAVTPLFVGNPRRGYRPTKHYGGEHGITLATAMAISGAAVSPAQGYHSSTLTALLMTLLNVRLGSWLGNPGPRREVKTPGTAGARSSASPKRPSWRKDGPKLALVPLLREAFGLTNDTSGIVYLSDGGHFENLGLYEMVQRRCRTIVLCDAGCDPKFEFADLANAVRKIRIDMGIEITFPGGLAMTPRPDPDAPPPARPPHAIYWAKGRICYPETAEQGELLYIKPCYYGGEPADVRGFAVAHPDFPHESTANQWFTEF